MKIKKLAVSQKTNYPPAITASALIERAASSIDWGVSISGSNLTKNILRDLELKLIMADEAPE